MAHGERADGGAATHFLTRGHGRVDRLVRRPQAVGVVDADHRAAGHHAREGDHPVAGREHR
jgi:hypothetical protein